MCWWTQLEEHTLINEVQCDLEPFVARRLSLKLYCTNECSRNCVQRREKGRRGRRAQSRQYEGMTCPTEPCQRQFWNNDNHHMCIKTRKMFKGLKKKKAKGCRQSRGFGLLRTKEAPCLGLQQLSATCRGTNTHLRASTDAKSDLKVPQVESWRQNSLLALLRCREWSDTGTRKASPG